MLYVCMYDVCMMYVCMFVCMYVCMYVLDLEDSYHSVLAILNLF